ncbi:MAG: hypothetical protein KGI27_12985 [Thaumarchaeota archaeon]|nr:hypothetical protein [Nitrososphaerota archaeon]
MVKVRKTIHIDGELKEERIPVINTICLNKNCQLGVDAGKLKDWVIRD